MNAARRWLLNALLIAGVVIIVGLAALNVFAWRGLLVEDQPEEPSAEGVTPPTASAPATTAQQADSSSLPGPTEFERPGAGIAQTAQLPAGATSASVVVTALRGDSYLEIRAGSPKGPVRWAGILQRGDSAEAVGKRLWIRMGAAQNVDVIVNGEPATSLPIPTGDVVVTADGIRTVSLG